MSEVTADWYFAQGMTCGKPAVSMLLHQQISAWLHAFSSTPYCHQAAICSSPASHLSLRAMHRVAQSTIHTGTNNSWGLACINDERWCRGDGLFTRMPSKEEKVPAQQTACLTWKAGKTDEAKLRLPVCWQRPSRSKRDNRWLLYANTTENLFRSQYFSALLLFHTSS